MKSQIIEAVQQLNTNEELTNSDAADCLHAEKNAGCHEFLAGRKIIQRVMENATLIITK